MISKFYNVATVLMIISIIETSIKKENLEKRMYESKMLYSFIIYSVTLISVVAYNLFKLVKVIAYNVSFSSLFSMLDIYLLVTILAIWSALFAKKIVITETGIFYELAFNKLRRLYSFDEIISVEINSKFQICLHLACGEKKVLHYSNNPKKETEKKKVEDIKLFIEKKLQEE